MHTTASGVSASAAALALREASERLLGDCARASDLQWLFRPTPEAWSTSQIVEHVAVSNRNIRALLAQRLLASPLSGRRADVIDVEIPFLFYRGDEPPNVGRPTGEWTDRPVALEALASSVRELLDWSAAADADLRRFGLPHPVFGLLDGVQWLLFAAAHMERHRSQVIGLRRLPGYPIQVA